MPRLLVLAVFTLFVECSFAESAVKLLQDPVWKDCSQRYMNRFSQMGRPEEGFRFIDSTCYEDDKSFPEVPEDGCFLRISGSNFDRFSRTANFETQLICMQKGLSTYAPPQEVTVCSSNGYINRPDARCKGFPVARAPATTQAKAKPPIKKQGVRLGMNKDEVIASSWGRPRRVNRTINASGTHEQWVYGDGNYLYFINGTLTTIQN